MGFGSYDESEQDNQEFETDFESDDGVNTSQASHGGEVEYEFSDASSEDLLDQLKEIKGE